MTTQREINRLANHFNQQAINERIKPPTVINSGSLYKGGGGINTIWATVIEPPLYSIDGVPGRNYYTLRDIDDATAIYNAETTYAADAECIGSDGLKYVSAQADNVGHDPTTSGITWWSQSPEIHVTKILGQTIISQSVVDAVPWAELGETVLVIYRDEEPYILAPSLLYTGLPGEATIRWNTEKHCAQAVFR